MDALHEQSFTPKAVRTGGPLLRTLEAKLHFQDGLAYLSMEKGDAAEKVAVGRSRRGDAGATRAGSRSSLVAQRGGLGAGRASLGAPQATRGASCPRCGVS